MYYLLMHWFLAHAPHIREAQRSNAFARFQAWRNSIPSKFRNGVCDLDPELVETKICKYSSKTLWRCRRCGVPRVPGGLKRIACPRRPSNLSLLQVLEAFMGKRRAKQHLANEKARKQVQKSKMTKVQREAQIRKKKQYWQ